MKERKKVFDILLNFIKNRNIKVFLIDLLLVILIILLYYFSFSSLYSNFREKKRKELSNDIVKKIDGIIENQVVSLTESKVSQKVVKIDNFKFTVLGKLEIKSIDINEPILKENTKESMDVSVVKIYGPMLNEKGNVVLGGHNYMKKNFFIKIMDLKNNDKITVTDLLGDKVDYYVYKSFKTTISDSSYFKPEFKNEKRELTLVTCTKGAVQRFVVKAVEK